MRNPQKLSSIKWLVAASLGCLSLIGCSSTSTERQQPSYRDEQIKEHPPQKNRITTYPSNTPYGGSVLSLAKQGNLLFAGTANGIHRSTDGGMSWEHIRATVGKDSISNFGLVAELASVGTTMFARLEPTSPSLSARRSEMYRSNDGGISWTPVDEPPFNPIGVESIRSGHGSLFVVFRFGDGKRELYRTSDLGSSWKKVEVSLNKTRVLVGTALDNEMFIGTSTGTYRSADGGRSWTPIYDAMGKPVWGYIFNVEDTLFAVPASLAQPPNYIYQLENGSSWKIRNGPQGVESINTVSVIGNILIAGTNKGIYYTVNESGLWKDANTGLRIRSSHDLIDIQEKRFVIVDEDYFVFGMGNIPIGSSQVYRSNDAGETWQVVSDSMRGDYRNHIYTLAVMDRTLFAGCTSGVFRSDDFGNSWQEVGTGDYRANGKLLSYPTSRLISVGTELYGVTEAPKNSVVRSIDRGASWESLTTGLNGDSVDSIAAVADSIFAATSNGLFILDKQRKVWESTGPNSVGGFKILSAAGTGLIAGTRGGDRSPISLFKINMSNDQSWKRLRGDNLQGELLSVYVDSEYPEIILAGTNKGLFWSTDGGDLFEKSNQEESYAPFQEVYSINRIQGQLFISTDAGLFYLYDQLPRGKSYQLAALRDHVWLFSGTLFVLLLMVALSTRLISLLLQLDIWGINKIAPAFYLSPFGRWKLYRVYRKRLRAAREIIYSVEHYIDLPFECNGEVTDLESGNQPTGAVKLSEIFTQLRPAKRAVVIAEGGRGKTTLCNYITYRCIVEHQTFHRKRLQPVIVEGLSYAGNLLNTITNALRENRAYVNTAIVSSQMAAGNLLVIFDGFSEIRETYSSAALTDDLPEFLRQQPDTPFIFTSRSSLPSAVEQALGDNVTIRLRDVDETTTRSFLSQYLKRGMQEVDALMREIAAQFSNLPRIPLMLKLVATVYDKKAKVPEDTATLFRDYAEQVLRPEATGIDEPTGLNYAITHLVRETYLRSGGDRGLTFDQAVELFEKIQDRLRSYDIDLSPAKLIRVLTRAGLYEQIGENLKFFHDSFESYFGARALESDFRNRKYDLIIMCAGNARLKEVWNFLEAILKQPDDANRLQQIILEGTPKREIRLRELERLLPENPYPRTPTF
jgi:photosystem II stability/assembly factor-like uncharacterized protein